MDDLRLPAVAARLVAWHNRHPLARRIAAAQVHAIGYVALPFAGAALPRAPSSLRATAEAADAVAEPASGGTLRERALARARQQQDAQARGDGGGSGGGVPALPMSALQPDFSEDFIDPLKPAEIARFAQRCGRLLARPPVDGPTRRVRQDHRHPGHARVPVYLLTAVIETGTRKSRVLLGAGPQAEVLGRRLLSRPRLGAVAGALLLVAGGIGLLLRPAPEAAAPALLAAAASAPVAGEAAGAGVAAPGSSAAADATAPGTAAGPPPADAAPRADGESAASAGAVANHIAGEPAANHAAGEPAAGATHAAGGAAADATHAAGDPAAGATHAAGEPAAGATHAAGGPAAVAGHAPGAAAMPADAGAAAAAAPPPDVRPRLGRVDLPPIRPELSDEAKAAARQARQALLAAASAPPSAAAGERGAPAPAAPAARPSAAPPAAPPAAAPATSRVAVAPAAAAERAAPALPPPPQGRAEAPPPGRAAAVAPRPAAAMAGPAPDPAAGESAYAVSTRPLRTRAEADQVRVAMLALLKTVAAGEVKVDVLPEGDDWRVVGFPFARRADADKARALLVSRGMRVEVVGF